MTIRVAIFISGGGSNMVSLVDAMQDKEFGAEPVLVLSNNAAAGGLQKAEARGIPTEVVSHKDFSNREDFEDALHQIVQTYNPDVICLAGFMRVLTNHFIGRWEGKMLNIHPSLLPKYKGLHTHARALEAGDDEAGCSVHLVTAKLDDGPVLGQRSVPVLTGDTADTLASRVLVEEHDLYPEVLRQFVSRK